MTHVWRTSTQMPAGMHDSRVMHAVTLSSMPDSPGSHLCRGKTAHRLTVCADACPAQR